MFYRFTKISIYIISLSLMLFMVASCTNVASMLNLDSDLTLNIVAKDDINPDDNETASPLVVRLYELKESKKFETLAFYDLYQNDKKLLGKQMIEKRVLKNFLPDTKRRQTLVLNKNTQYVGLFAEFSQYKDSDFRALIKIHPHFDKNVDVVLSGTTLRVEHKKLDPFLEEEKQGEEFKKGVEDANKAAEALSGLK